MATVTLTTDFGDGSPYVAALKGSVLSINPEARLLDLSHRLPPQDLAAAAYFLADALPWFAAGTIHVVVVDPGVGTQRAILCVEWAGQIVLVPDNGCWSSILRPGELPRVRRVENRKYWRPSVSATFHGRDILAPVAAHLSLGEDPRNLGPLVDDWVRLETKPPIIESDRLIGEVIFIDHFGNLITNIPGAEFARLGNQRVQIMVGDQHVHHRVRAYGEAEKGTLVALVSSADLLEVAVNGGSAQKELGARVGIPVTVQVVSPSNLTA